METKRITLLFVVMAGLWLTYAVSPCLLAEAATCTAASTPGGSFTDPTSTFAGCTITGWADFNFGSVASTAVALSLFVSGSMVQAGQRLSIAGFAGLTAHQPLNATIVDSTFSNSALRIAGTFPAGTTITVLRTVFTLLDAKLSVGQNVVGPPNYLNPNIFFSSVVLRDKSHFLIANSTISNIKNPASEYNIATIHSPLYTDLTLSNYSTVIFADSLIVARTLGFDPASWSLKNLDIYFQFRGFGCAMEFIRCNLTGYADTGNVNNALYVALAPSFPAAYADPPTPRLGAGSDALDAMPFFSSHASAALPFIKSSSPMPTMEKFGIFATSAVIFSGCRITSYGGRNGRETRFLLPPGTFLLFENTYIFGERSVVHMGQNQYLISVEQTQNVSVLLRGNTFDASAPLMRQAIMVMGPAWQSFNLVLFRNRILLNNDGMIILGTPTLTFGVTSTAITVHLLENTITGSATPRPLLQGYAAPHETVYACRNNYYGNRLVLKAQYDSTSGKTNVPLAALRYGCGSGTLSISPSPSATGVPSQSHPLGTPSRTMPKTQTNTLTASVSTPVTASPPAPSDTPTRKPSPSASSSIGTPSPATVNHTLSIPQSSTPFVSKATPSLTATLKTLHASESSSIRSTPSRELTPSPFCPPTPAPLTAHAWLEPPSRTGGPAYRVLFEPPPTEVFGLTNDSNAAQQTIHWGAEYAPSDADIAAQLPPDVPASVAILGHCTLATTTTATFEITCSLSGELVRAILRAYPDRTTTIRASVATGPCGRTLTLAIVIQPDIHAASTAVEVMLAVAATTALLTAIVDPTAIDAQLVTVVLLSACSHGGGARVSRYLLSPLIDLGPAAVALAHTWITVAVSALHLLAATVTAHRRKISFSAACYTVHFPSASFSLSSVLYAGAAWGTAAAIHSIGSADTTSTSTDLAAVACAVLLLLLPEPVLCALALLRTAARRHRFVTFRKVDWATANELNDAYEAPDTDVQEEHLVHDKPAFAKCVPLRLCGHSDRLRSEANKLRIWFLPFGAWEADPVDEVEAPVAVGSLRGLAGPRAPLLLVAMRLLFLLCCALITAPPRSGTCKGRLHATAAILAVSAVVILITRPFRVHATTALSAALALSIALLAAASAESHEGLTNAAIVLASVCAVLRGVHTAVVLVWERKQRKRKERMERDENMTASLEEELMPL